MKGGEGERERGREKEQKIEQTELIEGGPMDMCICPERKKDAEKRWNELTLILAHTYREKR